MSRELVFIAGSPSSASRSSFVAQVVSGYTIRAGLRWRTFSLADFEPADILFGRADAPGVRALVDAVKGSVGFVLASPVYKATYAGGLKAIVDLIPPDALVGKPALGIATTKLREHGAEAERAYRALFAFFRASTSETAVVLDDELHGEGSSRTLAPAAEKRLEQAAQALIRAVDGAPHASASS